MSKNLKWRCGGINKDTSINNNNNNNSYNNNNNNNNNNSTNNNTNNNNVNNKSNKLYVIYAGIRTQYSSKLNM